MAVKVKIEFCDGRSMKTEVSDRTYLDKIVKFLTEQNLISRATNTQGFSELFECHVHLELCGRKAGLSEGEEVNEALPRTAVKFASEDRQWIILKLQTGNNLHWIFGKRIENDRYIPVDLDLANYAIGDNGEIFVRDHAGNIFEFNLDNDRYPEVLLDLDYAISLGWIDKLLDPRNEGSPVKSLLKCPHPYKLHGTQIANVLNILRDHQRPR